MICIKDQLSLILPITIWSSLLLNAHANVEIKQNLSIHSQMYNKGNDTLGMNQSCGVVMQINMLFLKFTYRGILDQMFVKR